MVMKSRSIKDLDKGLPFFNREESTIYFRGSDFIKEYHRIYKDNATERSIWAALRNGGFERRQMRITGKPDWIWFYNLADEEPWFEIDIGEKF